MIKIFIFGFFLVSFIEGKFRPYVKKRPKAEASAAPAPAPEPVNITFILNALLPGYRTQPMVDVYFSDPSGDDIIGRAVHPKYRDMPQAEDKLVFDYKVYSLTWTKGKGQKLLFKTYEHEYNLFRGMDVDLVGQGVLDLDDIPDPWASTWIPINPFGKILFEKTKTLYFSVKVKNLPKKGFLEWGKSDLYLECSISRSNDPEHPHNRNSYAIWHRTEIVNNDHEAEWPLIEYPYYRQGKEAKLKFLVMDRDWRQVFYDDYLAGVFVDDFNQIFEENVPRTLKLQDASPIASITITPLSKI